MTRNDALKRFNQGLGNAGFRLKTRENYLRWIERFFDYVSPEDYSTLSVHDAQDYMEFLMAEKEYAPRTVNIAIYTLRFFFNYVLLIPVTPQMLPKIKMRDRKEKPVFTSEQCCILIEQCPNLRLKACIALGYGCGLRISEVTHLQFKDILKAQGRLLIRDSKGGKSRYVSYSPITAQILNDYVLTLPVSRRGPDDYVIQDIKKPGQPVRNSVITHEFSDYIRAFAFALGQTFHSLRHGHATELAMRNVPLPVIQQDMGHSSSATTAKYIHTPDTTPERLPDLLDMKGRNMK